MKKVLITIFFSIIVGGIFAFVIFKNVNDEVELAIKDENTVTYFQVGVFKNENNALEYMKNYSSSIIIKDDDYFRVIIAILESTAAIEKEKKYFDSLGIDYYLKKETISNSKFLDKLKEYEELLIQSDSNAYKTINSNILKLYESR